MSVNQPLLALQLQAALAAVQAAVSAAGDLSTATPFALQGVVAAINAEVATVQSAIATIDADIITTSVAGMVAANPAPTLWPILVSQAADSVQEATLLNGLGYLQRLAKNLSWATG